MGITAFLLIVAIQFAEGNARQKRLVGMDCLHCKRVAEAHDCQTVTTCNVDEECFTEMYITREGHIFVDLGCKTKVACDAINKYGRRSLSDLQRRQSDGRTTLCEQCCNGSSCNSKACDTYNGTRRICYTCLGEHAVTDPSECERVTMCNAEEQCYNSHGLSNEFNLRNELGCMSNQICATISHEANDGSRRSSAYQNLPILFGRNVNQSGNLSRIGRQEQDFFQTCRYCCDRNYCNKPECQQRSTPVTQKSIATTTTIVSTTRTTTSTPTTTLSAATLTTSVASTTPQPSITQKPITTTTTMLSSSRTTTMTPTTLSTSTTAAPPSTMPIMSLTTLTTSVALTTLQPSTICFVCGPQGCTNQSCTGATPYCLNVLDNNANGSKQETKRCGSELECERDWYNVTALSDICSVYEPWQLYASKFSCTYCCVRNYCNRDTNPPRETLYYPKNS